MGLSAALTCCRICSVHCFPYPLKQTGVRTPQVCCPACCAPKTQRKCVSSHFWLAVIRLGKFTVTEEGSPPWRTTQWKLVRDQDSFIIVICPEHKQAVTWARSRHARNSISSAERWCLLQKRVLSLILPAPYKPPNQLNHALSPGNGEFQLHWVLSQKWAPVWFLRCACPQEMEQGGFFSSTTPCIIHLGPQFLWGLYQIC